MDPNQTAPQSWVRIVSNIGYLKHKQTRGTEDRCCDWRENG